MDITACLDTNNKEVSNVYVSRINHVGGVMVSMLAPSAVDRGFESWSDQTYDYKISICCESTCLSADCYFSELPL